VLGGAEDVPEEAGGGGDVLAVQGVEGLREGVPAGDGGADRRAGVERFGMAVATAKEFRMRIGEKA